MNRIDITKTQHHYHCNNNVVVVTKKDGIQGPPGEEGITPHIDPETFHWFIGDVDTGIYAGMSNTDDITLLYLFDNRESFPSVGNVKDLYLDTETSTIYRWNAFSSTFVMFKADYVKELERAIVEAQTKLNNLEEEALKKPRVIVPGSLILAQGDGTVKCSDITYEELLEKIDEGGKVDFPTNLTPDALLVGSESGSIESSEISQSELIAVIENSKNAVKFSNEAATDALVLADGNGGIKGSEIKQSDLIAAIETSKKAVKYVGDIKHRSLVLSDESGGIDSSDIQYDELVDALEKSKKCVKFDSEEVKSNFVVITGKEEGEVKQSNVTHSELISAVVNSRNAVKYDGVVTQDALVLSNENGTIKSSDVKYSDVADAIQNAKNAVKYDSSIIPGNLVLSTDKGIESSDVSHSDLIAAIEASKKAVSYKGSSTNGMVLLAKDGGIESSSVSNTELSNAIAKANTAVQYSGTPVTNAVVISDNNGGVKSSSVQHIDLIAAIEASKKAVKYSGNVIAGNLVISDNNGGIESSSVSHSDLIAAIEAAKTSVKYNGTAVPGSLVIASNNGGVESSYITQNDLHSVIENSKRHVEFTGTVTPDTLVLADKSGNIKSSGKTFDELMEDIQSSSVKSDWNETNISSPAYIKNKPEIVTKTEYNSLKTTVNKKSGFAGTITPNALVMSDSIGNLYSTTLKTENIVTVDSLVSGAIHKYMSITSDGEELVKIPTDVTMYTHIDVYHNGKLLIQNVHYTLDGEYINLVGFSALKDDIFSFIGHGQITTMPLMVDGGGCDHSHLNLPILEGITQERVDEWDTITTHNHDTVYLKKDELFEDDTTIVPALLPVATTKTLGAVKSSGDINKISIAKDGTMNVNSLDISLLVSTDDSPEGGEDYSIVLSSGSSYSYRK